METQGINPNRIHLIKAPTDYISYLNLYKSIDIQLDTVPYSGYSTTANSLYMGVPVFSISGTTHVQNRSFLLHRYISLDGFTEPSRERPIMMCHNARNALRTGCRLVLMENNGFDMTIATDNVA